jgi:hypothetical protein
MSGCGYKDLAEALPRPPQQAFFPDFSLDNLLFSLFKLEKCWINTAQ